MKKIYFLSMALAAYLLLSCSQTTKNMEMVKKELFGIHNEKEVYLLTLTNKSGNILKLTNFGAKITWVEVPDRDGKRDNVTFGYDTFEETVNGDGTFGSTIGRYANRIAYGKFVMDGVEVVLMTKKKGDHSAHGGPKGWQSAVWNTEVLMNSKLPAVRFSYLSPDLESGFPGTMNVEVVYTWTDDNEIIMDYKCTTDKKTVINITNHAYFNLHGAGNGDILDHELMIRASSFTPVDSVMIPTGEIRSVTGTPFDFTTPHTVGERINDDIDQLKIGSGYDHTFVLDKNNEVNATVYDPSSGRLLEFITDQPGVHLYTGNFLRGKKGHGGKSYIHRSGLCLESGHYPDSPNHPEFPTTFINPGETFRSQTIYRFSTR